MLLIILVIGTVISPAIIHRQSEKICAYPAAAFAFAKLASVEPMQATRGHTDSQPDAISNWFARRIDHEYDLSGWPNDLLRFRWAIRRASIAVCAPIHGII